MTYTVFVGFVTHISGVDRVLPAKNLRNPRAYQFGITTETQLPAGITGSIAYVGTRGISLFRESTPQLGLDRSLVQFSSNVTSIVSRPGGTRTACSRFSAASCGHRRLHERPTPLPLRRLYSKARRLRAITRSSWNFERATKRGLEFGTAATYSHSIDDSSDFFDTAGAFALPQDSLNRSERGSSSFDVRFRSITHLYGSCPYARGTGGWDTGKWQERSLPTGQPYTVNSAIDVNRDGNETDRLQNADVLLRGAGDRRVRLSIPAGVNPADLLARDGKDGVVGRNTFRGPGLTAFNAVLSKSFRFQERRP